MIINKPCWYCKHFYEACTDCINKSKWEIWDGDTRNNSSTRGKQENTR